MTSGVGPVNHAFVFAKRPRLVLAANKAATRRIVRNVDPNRHVWLGLGAPAVIGEGVHLPPLGKPFETRFRGDIFAVSDRPTLMYDSTDAECLTGTPGLDGSDLLVPGRPGVSAPVEMVNGYTDGNFRWTKSAWDLVASNRIRKWGTSTSPPGSHAPDVDILDVEEDSGITADQAVTWAVEMRRLGRLPIIYMDTMGVPSWPQVIDAFKDRGVEQPHYFVVVWDNRPGLTGYNRELERYGLADQSSWVKAGVVAKQWQSGLRAVYANNPSASVTAAESLTLKPEFTASVGSLLRARIAFSGSSDPGEISLDGPWTQVAKAQVNGSTWLYVFDILGARGTERGVTFSWNGERAATAGYEEFAGWIGTPTRDPNFAGIVQTGQSSGFVGSSAQGLATPQQLCTAEIVWDSAPGGSYPTAYWGSENLSDPYDAVITSPDPTMSWAYCIPPFGRSNDLTAEGAQNGWTWEWPLTRDYAVVETNYYDSGAQYLQLGWDISSVYISDLAIQEEIE